MFPEHHFESAGKTVTIPHFVDICGCSTHVLHLPTPLDQGAEPPEAAVGMDLHCSAEQIANGTTVLQPDGSYGSAAFAADPYADFDGSNVLTMRYLYGPEVDTVLARRSAGGTVAWYL